MSSKTAVLAVAGGLTALAGSAQAQAMEAKASFIFNGQQIHIDKNNDDAGRYAAAFATPSAECSDTCIAPMTVAKGVATFDELAVLGFLLGEVARGTGLLVDARMPQDRAKGYIPGSVSLPFATMLGAGSFKRDILQALGARARDGAYSFADAQHLLVYDLGPGSNEAGVLITQLLNTGYPASKIHYYRGGMQVWSVLGFSIEGAG